MSPVRIAQKWIGPALMLSIGIGLITLFVFWPANRAGFIRYDDPEYVEANPNIRLGLSGKGLAWAFCGVHHCNWHPITTLSYLAEYQFFKLNPRPYHVHSVVLHAINAALLLMLLMRMTDALWRSALVAALFALHPLRVESVAWISERKDVLSGLFFILTIAAYLAYVRRGGAWRYGLALALYCCGLMSKPMLVTVPGVLLLLDLWPLKRAQIASFTSRVLLEKLPFLVLALISSVITFVVQRTSGAVVSTVTIPWSARCANALLAYTTYVSKTLWPVRLVVFYPFSGRMDLWPAACLALIAVSALVIWQLRRRPYLLVGWFWFIGMLIPVIGVVQVGDQAYADRYTYLPCIGLLMMLVWTIAEWVQQDRRFIGIAGAVAAVAIVACAVEDRYLIGFWRDTSSIFGRAAALVPRNAKAHLILGIDDEFAGRYLQAIDQFQLALSANPEYLQAYNHLGFSYASMNEFGLAAEVYSQSIRRMESDRFAWAGVERDSLYTEAVYNLSLVRTQQGDLQTASGLLEEAVHREPNNARFRAQLAYLRNRQGRFDDGISEAQRALRLDPSTAPAWANLAEAFIAKGNLAAAVSPLRHCVELNPGDSRAVFKLADLLDRLGRSSEAVDELEACLQRAPQDARAEWKLGLLLQSHRRASEAINHYRRAIAIDPHSAAVNNLAWMLATSPDPAIRNGAEAVRLAEEARRFTGAERVDVLDTLAAAYAEAGDFDRAVEMAQTAVQLAKKDVPASVQREIAARLALYEGRRPYREASASPATMRTAR